MKFKTKTKDCQLLIRVKTSFDEKIDAKELDRFSRIYLRGFLKPKLIKRNLIKYTGPLGISFYERFKKPITKRDFLFILEQIVVATQKLQSNSFNINGLIMNLQRVYINEVTKEVQFLYIPMVKDKQNTTLVDFLEMIAYSVKPADEKDTEFVSRFIYYLRAMNSFDIINIEAFVVKEDRSVVNTIKRQHAGQGKYILNNRKYYYEHYYDKEDTSSDNPTGLLHDEDATGLLNDKDKATDALAENRYEDATGLLNYEEATGALAENRYEGATGLLNYEEATGALAENRYEGATGLLNCEEATGALAENRYEDATVLFSKQNTSISYPSLYRVLTNENISINKPVFRLGKEKSYVDYFVTNNIAVSRGHADIITRNNRYFVKDLNSKNHTYINGEKLPVHYEVEICNGDQLMLGNEEFIFNI